MSKKIRIELAEDELRAVIELVGPHVSETAEEDTPLWRAERALDSALLACLRSGGPMTGIGLIAQERERQINEEGWTPEHDDKHGRDELRLAAIAYLDAHRRNPWASRDTPPTWPWDESWWKPDGTFRNLVKAGALIAAEIDRLQRRKTDVSLAIDLPNSRVVAGNLVRLRGFAERDGEYRIEQEASKTGDTLDGCSPLTYRLVPVGRTDGG